MGLCWLVADGRRPFVTVMCVAPSKSAAVWNVVDAADMGVCNAILTLLRLCACTMTGSRSFLFKEKDSLTASAEEWGRTLGATLAC